MARSSRDPAELAPELLGKPVMHQPAELSLSPESSALNRASGISGSAWGDDVQLSRDAFTPSFTHPLMQPTLTSSQEEQGSQEGDGRRRSSRRHVLSWMEYEEVTMSSDDDNQRKREKVAS
jgi:hypothetical protein